MNREKELMEEYEDILFKIMMDRVAKSEGARYLKENERLVEDPEAEVPESIQKHARQAIQGAFSTRRKQKRTRSLLRGLRVAVIAAILIALMVGFAFAAFPALKANVINTILNIYDTHTDFFFSEEEPISQKNGTSKVPLQVDWLPEGFALVDEVSNEEYTIRRYETEDQVIHVCKSFPRTYTIDTENAEITSIEMLGYEGTLIEKNKEKHILWLNADTSMVYDVYTDGLSLEEILKIAENLS